MSILSCAFYLGDTVQTAQRLLGKYVVRMLDGQALVARITETEAYVGRMDKAAHAYNYRQTARNAAMFGPPGHAYVYMTESHDQKSSRSSSHPLHRSRRDT